MKSVFWLLILCCSSIAYAGGWTATAPVEHVEIIRAQGFEIKGSFGNPSECTVGNTIFVSVDHPQYD